MQVRSEKQALRRFQRAARHARRAAHPEANAVREVQNRAGAAVHTIMCFSRCMGLPTPD